MEHSCSKLAAVDVDQVVEIWSSRSHRASKTWGDKGFEAPEAASRRAATCWGLRQASSRRATGAAYCSFQRSESQVMIDESGREAIINATRSPGERATAHRGPLSAPRFLTLRRQLKGAGGPTCRKNGARASRTPNLIDETAMGAPGCAKRRGIVGGLLSIARRHARGTQFPTTIGDESIPLRPASPDGQRGNADESDP